MNLKLKSLTKSIWVFHFASAPCNNCDIEILDALTPKFDLERFGILLVGSIRHADVLLVTGMITHITENNDALKSSKLFGVCEDLVYFGWLSRSPYSALLHVDRRSCRDLGDG